MADSSFDIVSKLDRQGSSFIGLLQRVDKSFRIRRGQKYTAVNADGFEVELVAVED